MPEARRPPATGDPELVRLTGAANEAEADMIVDLLAQHDIPTLVQRMAGFDAPGFLASGPRSLLVRSDQLAQARELVASYFGTDRPFG
jgi:hypothetical protein